MQTETELTVEFLRGIGLKVDWGKGATGFIRGVRIEVGTLLVDPDCAASNLLHEAGHLAITPPRYWSWMSGDIEAGITAMFEDINVRDLGPDHPVHRAALQCSDPEATAWAWAAGVEIGLAPEQVIQDHEYDGTGEEIRGYLLSSLHATTRVSGYFGIHGLAHAGMCSLRSGAAMPMYPKLRTWLQDADIVAVS